MTRPRTWTDEQLAQVVTSGECRNWTEVAVALGLGGYAVNATSVKRRADELGLTLPGSGKDPR